MPVLPNTALACAFLIATGGTAWAQEAIATGKKQSEDSSQTANKPQGPREVRLVSFDGGQRFLSTSSRLRIWRAEVGYRIDVDEHGEPTACKITQEFRRTYINLKLCEVLMEHHTFEPALDAKSEPIAGTFEHTLSYRELRAEG